jgi:hypothetical protein
LLALEAEQGIEGAIPGPDAKSNAGLNAHIFRKDPKANCPAVPVSLRWRPSELIFVQANHGDDDELHRRKLSGGHRFEG